MSIYIKHDKKAAVRSVSWNILTNTECNNVIGFSHRKFQKSDCPSVELTRYQKAVIQETNYISGSGNFVQII